MLLKRKLKEKLKNLVWYKHRFLRKFITRQGKIHFKRKYKLKPYFKNKVKKYIKRFRFLGIFGYTFKHLRKK